MHVLYIAFLFPVLLNSSWWGHIPHQHAPSEARLLTEYHHFCCMCCSWGRSWRVHTLATSPHQKFVFKL